MLEAVGELQQKRTALPKSRLGKALTYLLNQQGPLGTFLKNPRLPIHNNDEGRDMRHIIVGRKNWMIFASERARRLGGLLLPLEDLAAGRSRGHVKTDATGAFRLDGLTDRDYQLSLQRETSGTVSDSIRAGSNGVTLVFP